jgi:hypothetical protein
LMGQLSPKDIGHVLAVANQVYRVVAEETAWALPYTKQMVEKLFNGLEI